MHEARCQRRLPGEQESRQASAGQLPAEYAGRQAGGSLHQSPSQRVASCRPPSCRSWSATHGEDPREFAGRPHRPFGIATLRRFAGWRKRRAPLLMSRLMILESWSGGPLRRDITRRSQAGTLRWLYHARKRAITVTSADLGGGDRAGDRAGQIGRLQWSIADTASRGGTRPAEGAKCAGRHVRHRGRGPAGSVRCGVLVSTSGRAGRTHGAVQSGDCVCSRARPRDESGKGGPNIRAASPSTKANSLRGMPSCQQPGIGRPHSRDI
jgi:hypothetical protein